MWARTAGIPIKTTASLLAYAFQRQARDRRDHSVLQQLTQQAPRLPLPPGLELEWLGTAGFRLGYEGFQLLIDPYLTRAPLGSVLSRHALHSDEGAVLHALPQADAILVGHTHFDHVLDAQVLARAHRCPVYGSESLAALLAVQGLQGQAVVVRPLHAYELGPFVVTFVPSLHSKLLLGLAVPSGGEFTCDHLDGLHAGAYHCGAVYGIHIEVAGTTFYHQGSANLIDDQIIHRDVDFFLCGIAGRSFTDRYLPRVLTRLRPRYVIPHHFDDFFRPADAELGFSLNVNLAGFVDEVASVSSDFEVVALPLRPGPP